MFPKARRVLDYYHVVHAHGEQCHSNLGGKLVGAKRARVPEEGENGEEDLRLRDVSAAVWKDTGDGDFAKKCASHIIECVEVRLIFSSVYFSVAHTTAFNNFAHLLRDGSCPSLAKYHFFA